MIDDVVQKYLIKNAMLVRKSLALILAIRHLERISDHCVNIADDVIYIIDAKIVKHKNEIL